MKSTVCVVGLGYIGLPTAALLAGEGHDVVGVDIDPQIIALINAGGVHIVEPDLDELVRQVVETGKLRAAPAPAPSDVFMICVPTPFHEGPGIPQPNIDYVLAAARAIAPFVRPGNLVILESTSPVGTTELVGAELAAAGVDLGTVHVAYCPERVLPGKILCELITNDRIVGGLEPADGEAVGAFYRGFVKGRVLLADAKTAEMCKLTENSFRDVNIAFANELSMICAREGVDVWQLIALANCHPRVNILQPGPGVGGHCIAVDPWFIVARNPDQAQLIRTAREVNNAKTAWSIERIVEAVGGDRAKTVACLGLAFKPDIDDLRESPAMAVARGLAAAGLKTLHVEPNIAAHEGIIVDDLERAVAAADIVAILVRHRQFLTPEFADLLAGKQVLDLCGALNGS